jgi:hypothetical protein
VGTKLALGPKSSVDLRTWLTRRIAYELWQRRGEPIGDPWADWLAAEGLLASRRIGDAGARAMAECPDLSGYAELELEGHEIGDGGARALAESPYVAGLRELDLEKNQIGDEGVRSIAASSQLGQLQELDLEHNQIGDAGAAALAQSPLLGRLRALELRHNPIGDAGARALAESPHLSGGLKRLKLSSERLSAETVSLLRARLKSRVKLD